MKYIITIQREDDQSEGLDVLRDFVKNGLCCVAANVEEEVSENAITLSIDVEPSSLTGGGFQFNEDELEED